MPSELVNDVRGLIRDRVEAGQPVTDLERTFILSALGARVRAGQDVVDELEAAIADARRVCLTEPPGAYDPVIVDKRRRDAVLRLLAAARAALDYTPAPPTPVLPEEVADSTPLGGRPARADVDG